jgi:hypothetical protein
MICGVEFGKEFKNTVSTMLAVDGLGFPLDILGYFFYCIIITCYNVP